MNAIERRWELLLSVRGYLVRAVNEAARAAALNVHEGDEKMAQELQRCSTAVSFEIERCRPEMGAPERVTVPLRVVSE